MAQVQKGVRRGTAPERAHAALRTATAPARREGVSQRYIPGLQLLALLAPHQAPARTPPRSPGVAFHCSSTAWSSLRPLASERHFTHDTRQELDRGKPNAEKTSRSTLICSPSSVVLPGLWQVLGLMPTNPHTPKGMSRRAVSMRLSC